MLIGRRHVDRVVRLVLWLRGGRRAKIEFKSWWMVVCVFSTELYAYYTTSERESEKERERERARARERDRERECVCV